MATQCITMNNLQQVNGKGRRTRNARITTDTNTSIIKQTCPGTPSETFASKLSTSTPASASSLNENVPRNQPKPQVNHYKCNFLKCKNMMFCLLFIIIIIIL